MIVKSYLAYPDPNGTKTLLDQLNGVERCQAYAADKGELVIVVTESDTEAEDRALLERLEAIEGISHLAFVSAFDETLDSTE
ncbi:MAG: hypothetical protein OEZ54_08235 [Gemmatimonadota bacterium]|nr:hypothetical protein [Gemmatimonadota bacterium]